MDDLSELVAPREAVLCEGNPAGQVLGKNNAFDARCYDEIFATEFPDTKFISVGGSKEVANDHFGTAQMLEQLVEGVKIRRVIDRDDHSENDAVEFAKQGLIVLKRRHIESYLYDDEIIEAIYVKHDASDKLSAVLENKLAILSEATSTCGRPIDDVKASSAHLYRCIKKDLLLTACGNDQNAFARNVLVPLLRPGTQAYAALKHEIFG